MQVKKQNVVAVSPEFKQFLQDGTEKYSAPSKSREVMQATEKEISNAMLAFVETHRVQSEMVQAVEMVQENDEQGNPLVDTDGNPVMVETPSFDTDGNPVMVEIFHDLFDLEVSRELALRGSTVRANSKDNKIAELEAQLAALLAAKGQTA